MLTPMEQQHTLNVRVCST